jgi:hypothetical protein
MRILAMAVCLLSLPSPSAHGDCPVNYLSGGSAGHGLQISVTSAEGSVDGGPVLLGTPCAACYSWPLGYFRVSGSAPTDWFTAVEAHDQFQIVGPASATPLSFLARLRVSGTVGANAEGRAGLGKGDFATNVIFVPGGPGSISNQPVVIELSLLPNVPFNVTAELSVGSLFAYRSADLYAFLEFLDVPAGWNVVSCHGFDVPVPTERVTWSRVRAFYR